MTSTQELEQLMTSAEARGCCFEVETDKAAFRDEGRYIISTIKVISGIPGVGPGRMSPIYAAEKLRAFLAKDAS